MIGMRKEERNDATATCFEVGSQTTLSSEALQSASRTAHGDDESTGDGDDQKAPT
jgi:hypothetical protein